MYEEREAYLLELLALERRLNEARPNLQCDPRTDLPGTIVGRRGTDEGFCEIQIEATRLMEALGGEAVQPGSLHPPTPEHIRRKTAIEDRLDGILSITRDDR